MNLLPQIRRVLELIPGGRFEDGSRRWCLYDPLQHRYFEIDQNTKSILQKWVTSENVDDLKAATMLDHPQVAKGDIDTSIDFFVKNRLVHSPSCENLYSAHRASYRTLYSKIIHGYLFFKIPLVYPEPWIGNLANKLRWLQANAIKNLIFFFGIVGAIRLVERTEQFFTTLASFNTPSGYFGLLITLCFLKICHEFAHAFTAKWLGCRVGSMGIAFLVLFPILYTDTTDSWRLANTRQRLSITTAGIKVELYISAIALFLWSVLPPGLPQSVCFSLIIMGLVSSLLINLSPFMRFDGYFALSDMLKMPNLHTRAFNLGKWFLRNFLFGFKDDCPESFSNLRNAGLIFFGYFVWIYRFFLFLGIAVLVYKIDFKVLGVFLFIVEIYYFISRPIIKEMKVWWENRQKIKLTYTNSGILLLCMYTIFWSVSPSSHGIRVPAIASTHNTLGYYPTLSGELRYFLNEAKFVESGEVLARVVPTELDGEFRKAKMRLEIARLELRQSKINPLQKSDILLKIEEEVGAEVEFLAVSEKFNKTAIKADQAGFWQPSKLIATGSSLNANIKLGEVSDTRKTLVEGFLKTDNISSLQNHSGLFKSFDNNYIVNIEKFDLIPLEGNRLNRPEMADIYGGQIIVRASREKFFAEEPISRIRSVINTPYDETLPLSGYIVVNARKDSPVKRVFKAVITLLKEEAQL